MEPLYALTEHHRSTYHYRALHSVAGWSEVEPGGDPDKRRNHAHVAEDAPDQLLRRRQSLRHSRALVREPNAQVINDNCCYGDGECDADLGPPSATAELEPKEHSPRRRHSTDERKHGIHAVILRLWHGRFFYGGEDRVREKPRLTKVERGALRADPQFDRVVMRSHDNRMFPSLIWDASSAFYCHALPTNDLEDGGVDVQSRIEPDGVSGDEWRA